MQNQTKISVVFLGFKSSHQVHDKHFPHLSKLLDHVFCGWIFILRWWIDKFFKYIYIFWNAWFSTGKQRKFWFLKNGQHFLTTLKSLSSLCYCLRIFIFFTIFLNLSSINAKSSYVCLASIPTYFRKLKKNNF
jgi:hypothetical protein